MIDLDIHVRDKTYPADRQCTIKDLVFSVPTGEFVSLIGPSGVGKTTLLNIIGGLDSQFDGELRINKNLLSDNNVPVRRSYMFQEPRLMPWLTVKENIELVIKNETSDELIRQLLHDVELDGSESAFPLGLSGGMQRRVALARAFSIKPQLLLMDEPFVSLDLPTANRLRDYLLTIWQKTKPTVIFVTHDVREAILLSDRLIFLSNKPTTIIKEYQVELKRPRNSSAMAEIESVFNKLLNQYPEILSGNAYNIHDNNNPPQKIA
ncbi:MAG: ABC transporter ATP-binding protein [Proteobacteria bacterium]|nr:ABC transporter ATP-binding protein [Pseudomonadota bacterium]